MNGVLLNSERAAVMAYLRRHDADARGIAAALEMRLEKVSAALSSLDAQGLVEFISGRWQLSVEGERSPK